MKRTTKQPRNKYEWSIHDQLKANKISFQYEREKIPYVLACHYLTDWTIQTPTGEIIVETKGFFRQADKRKLRAVKKQHPERDIRILFYPSKNKKTLSEYTRWCDKNGFKWAIGSVPQEWLDGL